MRKREEKRRAFESRSRALEPLRTSGEEAQAVILEVEDLNLTYDVDDLHGMCIKLEVTPRSGSSFVAETYASIVKASLWKYSVGKKVFVNYDPGNREKVVMTRSGENINDN